MYCADIIAHFILRLEALSVLNMIWRKMQLYHISRLLIVLFFFFSAGACSQNQEPVEYPRIFGVESIQIRPADGYYDVIRMWMQKGFRNMTVVHAGPHDGLAFVPPARMKAIKSALRNNAIGGSPYDLITKDNYLFVASRLGLLNRVFWIIPYDHLAYINAELRVRIFLKNEASYFHKRDIESMRFGQGCVSGTLSDVAVSICSPAAVPPVPESVLMVIDAGFVPPYAAQRKMDDLSALKEFFSILTLKKTRTASVAVTTSPMMSAKSTYLSEIIAEILQNPSILSNEHPPSLWLLRTKADILLRYGEVKAASDELRKNNPVLLHDVYLRFMKAAADVLLSKNKVTAADDISALCTENTQLCRGIAETGAALRERGDAAGAETFLKKALAMQPALVSARFEYAATLYQSKKYSEAQKEAETIVSQPGYEVSAALLAGDCAFAMQRTVEAVRWYERAVQAYLERERRRLQPRELESLQRLKLLYEQQKNESAVKKLNDILAFE